ncbi:MAG: hypothetical protein NVSMB62_05900 [Acidobacteriaceae bacterium]
MNRRKMMVGIGAAGLLLEAARSEAQGTRAAASADTVYELRVYHTFPGKLEGLLARFRDHTMTIFRRHGIENVAYWTPTEDPLKDNALFYILRHPSREAAKANWAAFRDDPEWKQVSAASEANGKLVEKVDSTFLKLTDFSPNF